MAFYDLLKKGKPLVNLPDKGFLGLDPRYFTGQVLVLYDVPDPHLKIVFVSGDVITEDIVIHFFKGTYK